MPLLAGRRRREYSMPRFCVSGHLTTGVSPETFASEVIGHSEIAGLAEPRADKELIRRKTPMQMGLMTHRTGGW